MRLIDADVLIKKLLKVDDDVVRACIGVIMTERTAYDVEKVVEQLEKNRVEFENRNIIPFVTIDCAVQIVRRGGVQ